ncbi:adenylyltransferase/cytidyltransferase family protein [Candidatus Uhrbacteria bacterium]|nr:adenylyltransferase/cytidyltransferase family protein [Candidatus Uhrbacteria bacterium]
MKEMKVKKKPIVVAVSGGFDPLHVGHVRLMQEAKRLGDILVVIVNNDNWLRKKKGYVFMAENERAEIIKALACVDKVILTKHLATPTDMSVVKELRALKPDIFANGGDRTPITSVSKENILCRKIGCKTVFNVGHGGKVQSSSWLVDRAKKK